MGKGGPGASSWFCHSAHSTASLSFPSCLPTQTPWGGEGRPTPDSFHLALRLCCGLPDWASGDEEETGEATSPLEVLSQVKESAQRGRVGIPLPELWLRVQLCAKSPHAITASMSVLWSSNVVKSVFQAQEIIFPPNLFFFNGTLSQSMAPLSFQLFKRQT